MVKRGPAGVGGSLVNHSLQRHGGLPWPPGQALRKTHLWGRGSRLGCLTSETREQMGRGRLGPGWVTHKTLRFSKGIDEKEALPS